MKPSEEGYRLLIVEDDQVLREMLEHYLGNGGNTVDVAVNGREGYEKYLRNGYDLIITDLNMSEMTGTDLVRRVREHDDFVEVIERHQQALEHVGAGARFLQLELGAASDDLVAVFDIMQQHALERPQARLLFAARTLPEMRPDRLALLGAELFAKRLALLRRQPTPKLALLLRCQRAPPLLALLGREPVPVVAALALRLRIGAAGSGCQQRKQQSDRPTHCTNPVDGNGRRPTPRRPR